MKNVRVHDNGAAFCIMVDGLIVSAHSTLGAAWRQIEWMYAVASQRFTVGENEVPVREWVHYMHEQGYLDGVDWAA